MSSWCCSEEADFRLWIRELDQTCTRWLIDAPAFGRMSCLVNGAGRLSRFTAADMSPVEKLCLAKRRSQQQM